MPLNADVTLITGLLLLSTNFYHKHYSYARASTGSCFAALREGYSDPMMPLKTANTTALPIQSGVIKTVNVGNTAIMVLAITKLDPIPIRAPTPADRLTRRPAEVTYPR